ncbi:MAG: hypothetical protein ACRDFC_06955, partial [Ignavibacteria bacterium]
MVTKIILLPFISVLILLILSFTINQEAGRLNKKYPIVNITGDEVMLISKNDGLNNGMFNQTEPPLMYSDSVVQITDVFTGMRTLYDLQSNSIPQHIWQDPNNPDRIHLCFMWCLTPGFGCSFSRRTSYILSTDRGSTWTSLEVPLGASAGYPACYGLDDGRIVITNHSSPTGTARCHVFIEVAQGTGSFTTFDPGTTTPERIWPRLTTTSTNKVVFVASQNT